MHVAIANEILNQRMADLVYVVPCHAHRFKSDTDMAPFEDRVAMCREAFPLFGDISVHRVIPKGDSDPEAEGYGSTANLMEYFAEDLPFSDTLSVVVGEDNAKDILNGKWYNQQFLKDNYGFIIVPRAQAGEPDLLAKDMTMRGMVYAFLDYKVAGSSSEAREALRKGNTGEIYRLLPNSVLAYADAHDLYVKKVKLVTGGPDLLADGSNYDKNAYPKACNTVDVAITRLQGQSLQVLLIKRKFNPCINLWAIPGGFLDINKNETLEEAAVRELKEETDVSGVKVTQLKTYGDPDRDNRDRVISTFFYALLGADTLTGKIEALDDAADYMWQDMANVPPLAFDHNTILEDLALTLKEKALYTPVVFELLPREFTWRDVEQAYEALLGRKTSNIRRKIRAKYSLVAVGQTTGDRHRPAKTYRYDGERDGL